MKAFVYFAMVALPIGLALAAAAPDISKLPPAAAKKDLTYAKDIKPMIENSCLKCHSGEKPKSKYRVDTREAMVKGGESGDPAIVPGKSEKSLVVLYSADLVVDMEMPPTDKREKYPALTKEQIGLLRAWIDQGAK
ncbi:MAG TPA: c-type cytochrome domain-containing protein [Candidatus Binatia bacterium]|nr:c-type cytochrome domain-containing protein [Candidatus Binatia bacterium]